MSNKTNLIRVEDDNFTFENESITRIDHSNVIEPGRHWFCQQAVEGIYAKWEDKEFSFNEGLMYLITNIIFFDGKLHSVELLDDPSSSTYKGILTLPVLLENFEAVSEDVARAFRQKQIQDIQQQAADVQREMAEAQANPALLEAEVAAGLAAWEEELARKRAQSSDEPAPVRANLPALTKTGQFNVAGALNNRISSLDLAEFRHMAQREGKIAEIRGKWLQKKAEHLTSILSGMAPFYSEYAAVGLAAAHEGMARVTEVEKGLRSLHLYTGEGVSVVQVAEGEPAPYSEPLTIFQRKLFMDEEFSVWDDVDRMFDMSDSSLFMTALNENESLRQQLIPAARGVVAMAVRRSNVDYDTKTLMDAFEAAERNRENKALFLLVRNGGNWYTVHSKEPSHELSPRLFPTRNEMNEIFQGYDGERIDFTDLRFTNRTQEFDAKSLAYKRFLILACGLDHRSKIFGDFYPEQEALSFISMDFQRKYMRFVADDDSDVMLGDNIAPVHELIAQNHAQLAAGCRVIVFSKSLLAEREACPGAYNNGSVGKGGRHYSRMVKAVNKVMVLTVRRDKTDLVVSLPVERLNKLVQHGWNKLSPVVRPNFFVRVALNKLTSANLGYLITDTLRSEELRPYIYSRAQRAHHLDYIYGFKLAINHLKVEEALNESALAHLTAEAKVKYGLDLASAQMAAVSAAQGWRVRNPDANALPSESSTEYPNLDAELAEAAYAFTHALPQVKAHVASLGGKVVRIMRGKKGQLIAYYEQPDAEKDLRITRWEWAGRRTYTAAGKPTKDEHQTVWLTAGRIVGETEVYGCESAVKHRWPGDASGLALRKTKLDLVADMAEVLVGAFKGEREGVSDRAWLALTAVNAEAIKGRYERSDAISRDKRVLLPVAVDTATNILIGIRIPVYDVLYHYGSDAQRAALLEKGYTLPKPLKNSEGKVIPYEGPYMALHASKWFYLSQFTGPVGNDVSLSGFADFELYAPDAKYPNILDTHMNFVLRNSPETAPKRKFPMSSHTTYLTGPEIWMPPAFRTENGEATLSKYFPGLMTA